MRNLLSFILPLILVNKMRIPTHNSTKPDPGPIQYTLTNLSTCTNKEKLTQPQIRPNILLNPMPQPRFSITVPIKVSDTLHHSGSLHYNPTIMPCSGTSTTQALFSTMAKAPTHGTRARTALKKKNDTAADDLQKQVALKKKMREDKKKKWAEEKKADKEKKKKWDQEKAKANSVTISPPSINDATTGSDEVMIISTHEEPTAQTDDWTKAEDKEALARHGISPNHLFRKEAGETTEEGKEAPYKTKTVDLTAAENSPEKKRTKSAKVPSLVKESNQYTTKSFSIATTAYKYDHPRTYMEAAITLTKEDKPKEFIAAIKLLLSTGKILDPNLL
jgi:hypothetical protein